MPVFKPEDLSEAGAGASNLLQGLASTIANNVCSLYQNAPRGFVGSNPVSDAVNAFNSGFWDDFCGRLPEPKLPDAPSIPFTGGQCCGYVYRATGTYSRQLVDSQGNPVGAVENGLAYNLILDQGKVSGVFINSAGTGVDATVVSCSGVSNTRNYFNDGQYRLSNLTVSLSVFEGGADNCGNPPESYPDVLPQPQNPGTHTYTGNDGIQRDIDFSVDFDPTINGPLVRLPDIPNLCVGFGFAGIDIDLCTNKPGEGNGGDISDIEDKLDQLRDILDRLEEDSKENLNKEDTDDNPPDQTDPENEPPDGGISKCVPNLRFVKVTLTNVPPNANVEVGRAGFDRIDDAGWLTFTKDGFFFPPQRIEFGGAIFEAPPGVECFTMQLRFGFTAVVTTVVKDS